MAIASRNLKADYSVVAFSGKGVYQNYDQVKEETMVDLYDRALPFEEEIKWDAKKWVPDIVHVNLGTNDFAHVNPDSAAFVNKYLELLNAIHANYPDAKIICASGPMMSDYWPEGNKALSTFKRYLKAVVDEYKKTVDPDIYVIHYASQSGGYGCDWHPGLKTHEAMAKQLTAFINEQLK